MRFVTLLFIFFCAGMHFYFMREGKDVIAAVYNVGTLVIASVLACTLGRR